MDINETQTTEHRSEAIIPEAGLLGKAIGASSHLFSIGILASAAILIII